jgi:hypothetical protein
MNIDRTGIKLGYDVGVADSVKAVLVNVDQSIIVMVDPFQKNSVIHESKLHCVEP